MTSISEVPFFRNTTKKILCGEEDSIYGIIRIKLTPRQPIAGNLPVPVHLRMQHLIRLPRSMRDLHYKRWLITSWLISFQELEVEGISLNRNPTTDLEDQFTACIKDRVSFKVWTPLTIIIAEPTQNATILISLLTFSHRVLVTPFMRQ